MPNTLKPRRASILSISLASFVVFGATLLAAAQSPVAGDWVGTLNAGGQVLHIALHIIQEKDGSLSSTTDSIDQGDYGIPVTTTTFKDSRLVFTIDSLHVTFEGVLNENASEIDGKLTQGQAIELKLKRASAQSGAFSAVIGRLSRLRELPDGTWKTHSGDLAHGEAVNLDESGWQTIAPRSKAPNDAVWFRQTYEIPQTLSGYDLTGARVWFQFHAEANGPMPQILYFNGRRAAMGDDLEPVVLFDDAKPGNKVTVAVKLLHTVDTKNFSGATLKIDFPENRPNPEDLRKEFLSASLLVPSLAPDDPSQMNTLYGAVGAVDLKALDDHDQNKFIKAESRRVLASTPTLE